MEKPSKTSGFCFVSFVHNLQKTNKQTEFIRDSSVNLLLYNSEGNFRNTAEKEMAFVQIFPNRKVQPHSYHCLLGKF